MQLETLQKDMIAAMKAHDKQRKDAISSLISAIKKVAIDDERVIIRTKLEKPSKIKGLALI